MDLDLFCVMQSLKYFLFKWLVHTRPAEACVKKTKQNSDVVSLTVGVTHDEVGL